MIFNNEFAYVFTPGTEDVTVIDLRAQTVAKRIDLGGEAFVGSWGPNREKLYVPVQTDDEVKVIDHEERAVTETISVGPKPYGATADRVRPETDTTADVMAALAALGISFGGEDTTYCPRRCHCGTHHS